MPHLTLVIVEGRETGREFPVSGTTLVGRDPGADLVIADSEVSSRHASFVPADGGITVEDLGSTNGTFVNDQRVTGTQRLQAGDRVRIGETVVEIRAPAPGPAPAAPRCGVPAGRRRSRG